MSYPWTYTNLAQTQPLALSALARCPKPKGILEYRFQIHVQKQMLPPVDPRVLKRNPNFDVLYKDLCTRKLNPDGSTRDTKRQRIHDEIRQSLTTARINLISSSLLTTSLSDLPSKASHQLPAELHACIEIVTAQLTQQIAENDREILSGSVEQFTDNLSIIASALSEQLCIVADYLCQIADPLKTPSIQELSAKAEDLKESATLIQPQDLQEARLQLVNSAFALLATHRQLLEVGIRILEQTQHGALSRHAKSSAELLHARATLLGLQAKIHMFSHAPPVEFVAALKEFRKAQGSGEKTLRDREELAKRELELYERAGEKGMKDLAKRKKHLVSEIDRIEEEIRKLENGK